MNQLIIWFLLWLYYYKNYGRGLSLGLLVISHMSEISDCRTITCAIVYEISVFYFFKWQHIFFQNDLFFMSYQSLLFQESTRNNKFIMNLEDNKCEFHLIIEDVPRYCHALHTFWAFVHSVLELEMVFSIALLVWMQVKAKV